MKTKKIWVFGLGIVALVIAGLPVAYSPAPVVNVVHAAGPTATALGTVPSPITQGQPFVINLLVTSDASVDLTTISFGAANVCIGGTSTCANNLNYTQSPLDQITATQDEFFLQVPAGFLPATTANGTFNISLSGSGAFPTVTATQAFTVSGVTGATGNTFSTQITSVSGNTYTLTAYLNGAVCTVATCSGFTFTWLDGGSTITPTCNTASPFVCTVTFTGTTTHNISFTAVDSAGTSVTAPVRAITPGTTGADNGAPPPPGGAGTTVRTADSCNGIDITCYVKSMISAVAGFVTEVIFDIFAFAVLPFLQVALSIEPHSAAFAQLITPIWVVIRNLMDIFFVIVLILIGLGTLLRVSSIDYRKMLVWLVLMAVLINFSLVIAQAILGIADTLQAQFLPNNSNVIQYLAAALIKGPNANLTQNILASNSSAFTQLVMATIYMFFGFGALLAFGAVTIYLLIRVVALWFLLFLSPIAYGFNILPWTKRFASSWWSNFLRYAFFTPIMALGLHICALIAITQANYVSKLTQSNFQQALNPTFTQFVFNMLSPMLMIFCLLAVLKLASQFSIAGASVVSGTATKWANKPYQAVGSGARSVARGAGAVAKAPLVLANRAKQNFTSQLTKDAQGNQRTGLAGRASRLIFNIANPSTSWQRFKENYSGTQKNKEAEALAQDTANKVNRFRQTHGIERGGGVTDAEKKKRDEIYQKVQTMKLNEVVTEVARLTNIVANPGQGTFPGFANAQSKAAQERLQIIIAAQAQKSNLHTMVTTGMNNQQIQAYDADARPDVRTYIAAASGGNAAFEAATLKEVDAQAKKSNQLGFVGINEANPADQAAKQLQYINNLPATEFLGLEFRGVPRNPAMLAAVRAKFESNELSNKQRRDAKGSIRQYVDIEGHYKDPQTHQYTAQWAPLFAQ